MSDITPEQVARYIASGHRGAVGRGGIYVVSGYEGHVVHAEVVEGSDRRPFRAVVVEGEQTPIVVAPEVLAAARALYRVHVLEASSALSAEKYGDALLGLQAALDTLTPEQVAVLAGDGPEAAQAETGGDDA